MCVHDQSLFVSLYHLCHNKCVHVHVPLSVQALRVSDGLQAGTVFVNTYNKTDVAAPFGGFKQSGFGKDLGRNKCKI